MRIVAKETIEYYELKEGNMVIRMRVYPRTEEHPEDVIELLSLEDNSIEQTDGMTFVNGQVVSGWIAEKYFPIIQKARETILKEGTA